MLYAITRRQDGNLAILALVCRAAEAALYAVGLTSVLTLRYLSELAAGSSGSELCLGCHLGPDVRLRGVGGLVAPDQGAELPEAGRVDRLVARA